MLVLGACSTHDASPTATGGSSAGPGTGGIDPRGGNPSVGGDAAGGDVTGGGGTGGAGSTQASGGESSGAAATGNVPATGGIESIGGSSLDGAGSGNVATGGVTTGGVGVGGAPPGATGGALLTGGSDTGGTAGTTSTGGGGNTDAGGTGGMNGTGGLEGRGGLGGLLGVQTGTVGDTAVSPEGDFERAKIAIEGEQYIIQNNNYGDPANTNLIIEYVNNGFTVIEGAGVGPRAGEPASFPAIYIGANGETNHGVFATTPTDNLPIQLSQITRVDTKFAWSGTTTSFAACYELWLANSTPTTTYLDALDGFVRLWLHAPSDEQPLGTQQGEVVAAGQAWEVWVGPRGEGPAGYNPAPVVTFVARSDVPAMTFDLAEFLDAAADYGIHPSLYLTDVFFGFQIFTGGAGEDLSVDEFTCVVAN